MVLRRNELVSIVVPVYNAADFLAETIQSVKNQTYNNWELILINDCSTDDSKAVATPFLNSKIHWFDLPKNSGVARARNEGLKHASGRFIAFLDADDFWSKDKLETQVKFMQKHDCAFSFTSYEFVKHNGTKTRKIVHAQKSVNYKQSLKKNNICICTTMFDMDKINKIDIIFPEIPTGEDIAVIRRLLRNKVKNAFGIDKTMFFYRQYSSTLSSNKIKGAKRAWFLYRKIEKLDFLSSCFYFCLWAIDAVNRRRHKDML